MVDRKITGLTKLQKPAQISPKDLIAGNRSTLKQEDQGTSVPEEKKQSSFYIAPADLRRAQAAYAFTSAHEGEGSWSEFVVKAILALAEARESIFNEGRPFPTTGTVRKGRPLS